MAAGGRFSFADMQNPLFLHLSNVPLSVSVTKLQGAGDYRSWKRLFEIQLSSKRKLGFLNGTVTRSTTDETQVVQWDTCNDLVISWLRANVSDSIEQSILFITSAHETWTQLDKRFQLTNGSRKYKLNKDLFSLSQNKMSANDYFTKFSSLWEEIDSMNSLPTIATPTNEVKNLLNVIVTQKEESKLFIFRNGLDEIYSPIRSQLLMQQPLPSVNGACSVILQEESQRTVLQVPDAKFSTMFTKRHVDTRTIICSACGGKGHVGERCWTVIKYPPWHLKHKKPIQKNVASSSYKKPTTKRTISRMVNNITRGNCDSQMEEEIVFSSQQLQQLLKLIPSQTLHSFKGSDTMKTKRE